MIYATILADSISPQGVRLTTWQVTCHRWILAEVNTHRVLSRNYRSSRAVPVTRLVEEVRTYPALPIEWRKNKPGMVGGELMTLEEAEAAKAEWMRAASDAAYHAESLGTYYHVHKQWANRGLEPYLYVHGVISATDTANFFHLRRASDAQPEFRILADSMWEAMQASTPARLEPGEWHLPYVLTEERRVHDCVTIVKLSAARCARVSVKPFDGNDAVAAELERAERLIKDTHMSPFEHQATPDTNCNWPFAGHWWEHADQHGNFYGWRQFRKTISGECKLDRKT